MVNHFAVFYINFRTEEETSLIEHESEILFVFREWLTSKTIGSRINILKDDEVGKGSLIFSC